MSDTDSPLGALRPAFGGYGTSLLMQACRVCFDDDTDGGGGDDAAAKAAAEKAAADAKAKGDKPDQDAAFAEMRRQLKAAEKAKADAEAKVAERDRKDAEAQGRWKELAEAAEAKAADLEAKVKDGERRNRVVNAAQRLDFNDPEDAHRFISPDDADDPQLLERALKALAKERPYLIKSTIRRTGREVTGGDVPKDKNGKPDARYVMGSAVLAAVAERTGRTFSTSGDED